MPDRSPSTQRGTGERYPLLKRALAEGRVDGSSKPDPAKREPRCGPWDEQEDGSFVCRKCGDVDFPDGGGPLGF